MHNTHTGSLKHVLSKLCCDTAFGSTSTPRDTIPPTIKLAIPQPLQTLPPEKESIDLEINTQRANQADQRTAIHWPNLYSKAAKSCIHSDPTVNLKPSGTTPTVAESTTTISTTTVVSLTASPLTGTLHRSSLHQSSLAPRPLFAIGSTSHQAALAQISTTSLCAPRRLLHHGGHETTSHAMAKRSVTYGLGEAILTACSTSPPVRRIRTLRANMPRTAPTCHMVATVSRATSMRRADGGTIVVYSMRSSSLVRNPATRSRRCSAGATLDRWR